MTKYNITFDEKVIQKKMTNGDIRTRISKHEAIKDGVVNVTVYNKEKYLKYLSK